MIFQRSQLIVMVRATMSTLPSWRAFSRSPAVMTFGVILFGSAEDGLRDRVEHVDVEALDLLVTGLRAPSRSESADTPAMRWPRFWMVLM